VPPGRNVEPPLFSGSANSAPHSLDILSNGIRGMRRRRRQNPVMSLNPQVFMVDSPIYDDPDVISQYIHPDGVAASDLNASTVA